MVYLGGIPAVEQPEVSLVVGPRPPSRCYPERLVTRGQFPLPAKGTYNPVKPLGPLQPCLVGALRVDVATPSQEATAGGRLS
jgi:hypothetical protein